MECSQKTESHHAGTQSPIMLGVTVGGAGVEITSARNVGIEHLYVIYAGSMLAIVFIGLKLLWGPSILSFRHYFTSTSLSGGPNLCFIVSLKILLCFVRTFRSLQYFLGPGAV